MQDVGDATGLIVMVLIIVVLLAGAFLLNRSKSSGGKPANDTLNDDPRATERELRDEDPRHGSGGIPVDRLTPDGSGTAVAGAGAGGVTSDARDPLTNGGSDSGDSPDT